MSISAVSGPLMVFGSDPLIPGQDYNPEQGPSLAYGGFGVLDPRGQFSWNPGQNFGEPVMGWLDQFSSVTVNYIPSTLATANIAALANVVSGTPMTLVSSTGSGITTGITITNQGTNTFVSGLLGIDIPTSVNSAASIAANGVMTVTTASAVQPLSLGMTLTGTGVPAGTVITGYITGGGYVGTYQTNCTIVVSSTSITGTQLNGYNTIAFGQVAAVNCWNPAACFSRAISITGVAGGTGGNFLVSGYDIYGFPMTQTVTVAAGANTVNSLKSFKYIASVTPQFTDAHNYSVGTADVYGFPLRSDVFGVGGAPVDISIYWNGALITANTGYLPAVVTSPATSLTGDVRGTYAVQSASNGAKVFTVIQSPSLPNSSSAIGQFGVTPA